MIFIPMTAAQAGIVANAAIAAMGREAWYRCSYAEGELRVPDDLADAIKAIDPERVPAAALVAYATAKRWQVEVGGVTIGGMAVATDDRSKVMILGARVAAQADPEWATVWHGADGGAYPLNAAAMVAVSNAVEAHVNATFALFAQVKADIDAGKITTVTEIDAAFA